MSTSHVVVDVKNRQQRRRGQLLRPLDRAYLSLILCSQRKPDPKREPEAFITRLRGYGGIVRLIGDLAGIRQLQKCCICDCGDREPLVRSCPCEMAPYVHLTCAAGKIANKPTCQACGKPWKSRMVPDKSCCATMIEWCGGALIGLFLLLPIPLLVLEQLAIAGHLFPNMALVDSQPRALALVLAHRVLLLLAQAILPRAVSGWTLVIQHIGTWWHVLLEVISHIVLRVFRVASDASPIEAWLFLAVSASVTPASWIAFEWLRARSPPDDLFAHSWWSPFLASIVVQPAWIAMWINTAGSDYMGLYIWVATQCAALLARIRFWWRAPSPVHYADGKWHNFHWLAKLEEKAAARDSTLAMDSLCVDCWPTPPTPSSRLSTMQWFFAWSAWYVLYQAVLIVWIWLTAGLGSLFGANSIDSAPAWASFFQLAIIGVTCMSWFCVCASVRSSLTARLVFIPG